METTEATKFHEIIKGMVEAWCDRRAYRPLSILLRPWLGLTGLSDSWHDLRQALRHVRAMAKDDLTDSERGLLNQAIAMVDKALWRDDGANPPT
jgi:hypothetical protein